MRRLALTSVALAAALSMTGTVASAERPAGSAKTCPHGFTPMTLPDILAQAQRLGVPETAARGMFARVNKNDDAWICQRKLPGADTHYTFIDNQAVGLDRRR